MLDLNTGLIITVIGGLIIALISFIFGKFRSKVLGFKCVKLRLLKKRMNSSRGKYIIERFVEEYCIGKTANSIFHHKPHGKKWDDLHEELCRECGILPDSETHKIFMEIIKDKVPPLTYGGRE